LSDKKYIESAPLSISEKKKTSFKPSNIARTNEDINKEDAVYYIIDDDGNNSEEHLCFDLSKNQKRNFQERKNGCNFYFLMLVCLIQKFKKWK
jgi:hypothetical protein